MHRKMLMKPHAMKITSLCLAALLMPYAGPLAVAQQESAQAQQTAGSPPPLPSMPAQNPQQSAGQDSSPASGGALPSAPDPQLPRPSQQEPQQLPALPQQPVGTAAAPAEKPSGIPGSRPSGAAIAPAKQKRVRAFVISIGIALAGAAAVGTVVGLSRASHSTPQ